MPPVFANLALLAPTGLLLTALLPTHASAHAPPRWLGASRLATAFALLLAVLAALVPAVQGATSGPLIGEAGIGLSVRLDAISCSLFVLVAFVGVIVVRYSRNYLDGDPRQGTFLAGLCLALAAVMLMVLSGNLAQLFAAWVATSLALHRMLVFYGERRAARIAARKKYVVARLGDLCLASAIVLTVHAVGSTDLGTVLEHARAMQPHTAPWTLQLAALLIGIAALLKSAQFPSHGWLMEVMETPTPVSALLHAGIINAGGFLMIRFADVMVLSRGSLHFIAMVGGFTSLFAGVVMLTQTSVKGSLAWSTMAQMGFMTLQCGLGAFAVALLHLLAHSLYKAHAFLSSGSVVHVPPVIVQRRPRVLPLLASVLVALVLYASIGWLFGAFDRGNAAVLTLGAILVLGISMLVAPSMQRGHGMKLLARTAWAAAIATTAYFVLEANLVRMTASAVPAIPRPDATSGAIMVLALLSFAGVTVMQAMVPRWLQRPAWRAARVHLANGLYVNALFNRLVGAQRIES